MRVFATDRFKKRKQNKSNFDVGGGVQVEQFNVSEFISILLSFFV